MFVVIIDVLWICFVHIVFYFLTMLLLLFSIIESLLPHLFQVSLQAQLLLKHLQALMYLLDTILVNNKIPHEFRPSGLHVESTQSESHLSWIWPHCKYSNLPSMLVLPQVLSP